LARGLLSKSLKEGVAPGVEGEEARPPDLRKVSRDWRISGRPFGVWLVGLRRGGGDVADERMRSRMSWKSEDAESRGRAPGLDCGGEGAASGSLAGGGGGGKGGFEEKKARGTGRKGLLRGVMRRSAMAAAAAAADGGGGRGSLPLPL
jgi:hypothetical protein